MLIDGDAGSGKSTLAAALAAAWPTPVDVVSLDDLYPGWDGLAEGSTAVVRDLLRRWRPGYRRWDWASAARAEWVPLDPARPLIVEGCGALTSATRALATFAIWCEADAVERRRRALDRDPAFAAHWDRWAAQEAEHWRLDNPRSLADLEFGEQGFGEPAADRAQ